MKRESIQVIHRLGKNRLPVAIRPRITATLWLATWMLLAAAETRGQDDGNPMSLFPQAAPGLPPDEVEAAPPARQRPGRVPLGNRLQPPPAASDSDNFDQQDPTQSPPDVRRILEGEQEQVRRDPPPAIDVVGKVIGVGGTGKAMLRVNGRYFLIEQGSRFTLPTGTDPIVYNVVAIDGKGVEIQSSEDQQIKRLP